MLDIKQLLDKYRIQYREHGANCARGHANISCPFCKNDPSWHMSINLASGQYYCFRNPRHAGNLVGYLLRQLNIPFKEYVGQKLSEGIREYEEDKRDYSAAKYFEPGEESIEVLNYLKSRLFTNPSEVCKQFELKFSRQGEWAGRLIIPLTAGWTGRAMRQHIEPRYDAWTNENGFFLFKHGSDSVIVVEGALDAMKVAVTSAQFDVVAKCKMIISPAILRFLRDANYQSIYEAPDGNVPALEVFQEMKLIKSYCGTSATVKRLVMPQYTKDFGQMTESETRKALPV